MKKVLTIVLSLVATAAIALEGGNSSGGDESPWAITIPYEVSSATVIGVVDTIKQGSPTWKVTFRKTFLAHGSTVEVLAPVNQRTTPKVGDLLFLSGKSEPFTILPVVDSTSEREKAIAEYLFEADAKARLEWADRYAKSADGYVAHSALAELDAQSRGKEKVLVVHILATNPNLAQFQTYVHVAAKLLPDPDALAIVKKVALDPKEFFSERWSAMYAIVWRKDRAFRDLVEAWKDGREGADKWLQDEAQKAWDKIYNPKPKP